MEEEEFVNPNFIVTQKINQIGKVLNEIKEKQTEILCNTSTLQNAPDYEQASSDAKNLTQQIKIIQEENKNRVLFLKKPLSVADYQPEKELKFKKPPIDKQKNMIDKTKRLIICKIFMKFNNSNRKNHASIIFQQIQLLKLENTYTDCYFGSDILSECLKTNDDVLPLIKRRSNGSVLIKKDTNQYEYLFTNYQTNCLLGIQFGFNSNLLTNHYNIDVKKQIEYNPIEKVSKVLGLNKIQINEQSYLQVRSIYNLHHLKINSKNEVQFKGVECSYFSDENENYKELLDCVQSNFFEEEQYILGEGNSIFRLNNLNEVSLISQLKSLRSNVESIDTSYHPQLIYLQMTDGIGLFDIRCKEPNIIQQVPTKKVPLHRIYAFKNLEENYFMVSTTQHFKIYDIRCTNFPVYSVQHGSDECPPTIINVNGDSDQEDDDGDIADAFLNDESLNIMQQKGSHRYEKIITSYSPHKNGDVLFMRWCKGRTLLESLYEDKNQNKYSSKHDQQRKTNSDLHNSLYNINQDKSDQSQENSQDDGNNSFKNRNDFHFKFLQQLSSGEKNNKPQKQINFFSNQNDESQSSQIKSGNQSKSVITSHHDQDDESSNGSTQKKLQKYQVLGRESRGERLCYNQEVKNLFQPKSILSSTYISDVLKVRGVCTSYFEEQDKFFTLQCDSKGGVVAQIFTCKNETSPLTSCYVPLRAVGSQTTPLPDFDKNDPQLASINDLQIMKIFEKQDLTDKYKINSDLITEPVRLRKQKKKQVNMFPYFNFLRDQVDKVKEQNINEINQFIEQQKIKRKGKFEQQQSSQKSDIDNMFNSQFSNLNGHELQQSGAKNQIKEIIQEQNNLLSVYHDKYAYPEFRKNMKYNTKQLMTEKNYQNLETYWD